MRLYVMTGDFMTGKTTWIMRMLDEAREGAIKLAGIVAPAVFECGRKTGIDALLLPQRERFSLARPKSGGFVDEQARHAKTSGNSTPKSGWDFDDAAMARVNEHLAAPACTDCDLLIVDELGPLELVRGKGYSQALRLLDAGKPASALVVVRPALIERAHGRWGYFEELTPESDVSSFLAVL